MENAILTYEQALARTGSDYRLSQALKRGLFHKVARGTYSTERHPDPYLLAHALYPEAVVTLDSAFFIYGLTDVAPSQVHLATRRNSTRIHRLGFKQYFLEDSIFEPGSRELEYHGGVIRIYSLERMLVELARCSASMPLDYYKEVIAGYRRLVEDIDISQVEEYMDVFERNGRMFDILQREVL